MAIKLFRPYFLSDAAYLTFGRIRPADVNGVLFGYYAIRRIINRTLYSHLLSIISFSTIAFFYTGVGGHHLRQSPIPEGLKTIAVVTTVLMLIPVFNFVMNTGLIWLN